ncbi:hypothetical protein CALCODRAFT_482957 [Calocera cornea HHB12733]|uniref:Alpha-type protein kinase domain-containing protein n=1 Tax=Calocera cornea HHB12733 TaxID=1353952 RepID=A0A165G5I7_9BASI|nr:hypothetical protein CALCODRAFT_482957 [Calocera cornea HHB12733]
MISEPGTFKTPHRGIVTLLESPIHWDNAPVELFPLGRRTEVAVKRYYIRSSPNGLRLRAPVSDENAFLEKEGNTHYWAVALHMSAMDWVDNYLKANPGSPACTLELPKTRFVMAGLFQHQHGEQSDARAGLVVLIEELIQSKETSGGFLKFISNRSPKPRFTSGAAGTVAHFLSFLQHVQYNMTEKQAFVSDYQGSLTLLSDPQILSHPDLGPIFGDGNVSEAFKHFEPKHPCNDYCRAFGLPPLLGANDRHDDTDGNKNGGLASTTNQTTVLSGPARTDSPSLPSLSDAVRQAKDDIAKELAGRHTEKVKKHPGRKKAPVAQTAEARLEGSRPAGEQRHSERLKEKAADKSKKGSART